MKEEDVLKVYTGPLVNANLIKDQLENRGIETFQDNDYSTKNLESSNTVPDKLDVYVHKKNLAKAQLVIEEVYIDLMDE